MWCIHLFNSSSNESSLNAQSCQWVKGATYQYVVLTEVENFSSKWNSKYNLNSSIFWLGSCICFPGDHMTCPQTWCLQAAETGHLIDWGCGVSHSDAGRLFLVQASW